MLKTMAKYVGILRITDHVAPKSNTMRQSYKYDTS